MKYSKRYTSPRGIIYFSNPGTRLIFSLKLFLGISMICSWLSIPFLVIGILDCGGWTRTNQKVIPCMIGTINISNNVSSLLNHVVREA